MKTDIQIAQEAKIVNILEIAKKVGLTEDDIEQYGKYKAKVNLNVLKRLEDKKDGLLGLDIMERFKLVILNLKDMYLEAIPY